MYILEKVIVWFIASFSTKLFPRILIYGQHASFFRSEVFDKMLNSNMSEAEGGEVVVEDIEPEVLQKVVEFMYTGGSI